ncbi:DUF3604 domain-containing protein [Myxococcota bacterium]|nr:DUF3604 domain-containing protein [Myxococcota bacterium]
MRGGFGTLVSTFVFGWVAMAHASDPAASEPGCSKGDPLGQAFFGDLHVHTGLSMDAYTEGVRVTPDDAYRFARGEPIEIAGGRTLRLERPLDFAAVTDHAEFLGEVALCTQADSSVYGSEICARYRGEMDAGPSGNSSRMGAITGRGPSLEAMLTPAPPQRVPELCGEDGAACQQEMATVWGRIRAAAQRWNDTSPECRFTTFHAYEYTNTPELSKVHRNVIFRNAEVPELPVTSVEEPEAVGLWQRLRDDCLDAGTGCDVLAIPHNSNLSNGRMFTVETEGLSPDEQVARARLRARLEPLVEVMQVKGDSECRNGMTGVVGRDEWCEFEEFRRPAQPAECAEGETGVGALIARGCLSRVDYVRYALIEGLREAARIGVNPYTLGFIASTDTHNGIPGATEENAYPGAGGNREDSVAKRLASAGPIVHTARSNPGGLAGIWAPRNTRDALFDAMRRRETFGTSGTRIQPRFFGGWGFGEDVCERAGWIEDAYAQGVPMGGELLPRPADAAAGPVFVAAATRDPGTAKSPGGLLQRIQIIKGWVGDDGDFHQRVVDVAGGETGASVDEATCRPTGRGHATLCGVWRDPEFDPQRRAVYYARVLENPSCRWTARQCLTLPESERPETCSDSTIPRTVQERSWTSPIWYELAGSTPSG